MPRVRTLLAASAIIAALLAPVACDGSKPSADNDTGGDASDEVGAVNVDNPDECAACHEHIVAEWRESMHSRAHESNDPIFGAMRALRMKVQGGQVANACANCHYPRDAKMEQPEVAAHGVSCASCHQVDALHHERGPGAKAIEWSADGVMAGPYDLEPGTSPAHATGPAKDFITDGFTLCMTCHDKLHTPADQPACTTGPEWRGEAETGGETCVSCHMPVVESAGGSANPARTSHRSHRFLGPHRAWYQDDASFLASAVAVSARFDGDAVIVTLANKSGHAFPTGFPGRMAMVLVDAFAADGAEPVWSSHDEGLAEHPQALLRKVYVNDEGQPTPAAFATKLKSDTRLTTNETREIRFEGLPADAVRIEVRLAFRLLPPPLAKKLELDGIEAQPKTIHHLTVTRE